MSLPMLSFYLPGYQSYSDLMIGGITLIVGFLCVGFSAISLAGRKRR